MNNPEEILESFKAYYTTATLSDVTDPNIVLDLKAKLDALGLYDENEIDRVVNVVMDLNARQKQYEAAITPVADRLLKQFTAAKTARAEALAAKDDKAAQAAKDEMDTLILFKADMQTYLRVYTFLSQIIDYGNTDFEKRSIFYRALVRLLKFGREREGVDLSEVKLTHHHVRNRGKQNLNLSEGDTSKLPPITDAGSGQVRDKEKARLSEIIQKVNELFEGDLTDNDKLQYVDSVIKEELLESKVLAKQATSNTKEQFAGSPDLGFEVEGAIIDALDAHTTMSTQALESKQVQREIIKILLDHSNLYEDLRERASAV